MNDHYRHQTLCILGGGQLGKMLIQKAWQLDMKIIALDHDPNGPCRILGKNLHIGKYDDFNDVMNIGLQADRITVEIEHVSVPALEKLRDLGKIVHPSPEILALVQDKGAQKLFYSEKGYPTADFILIENKNEIQHWKGTFPVIQKTRKGGYDGKGVTKIDALGQLSKAFDEPSVLEECLNIASEISVLVARDEKGQITAFPPVEMLFNEKAHLVEFLISPPRIQVAKEVTDLACSLARDLNITGILAVEVFLNDSDKIYINEIAPRPHNSGHMTIEANATSQFEQHLRAVYGLPLGSTEAIAPAVMLNILGAEAEGEVHYQGLEHVFQTGGAHLHLYGKTHTKPFRKMGHITILDRTVEKALLKARFLQEKVSVTAVNAR